MIKLAVLLTSFNRVEKTKHCISLLYNQKGLKDVKIMVFLTDDNSSDMTGQILKNEFPNINVSYGDGNLFWTGGMNNSWQMALDHEIDFDYYFLLNDDTFMIEDCLSKLLKFNIKFKQKYHKENITIGTTIDPDSGNYTYGGWKLFSKYRLKYFFVFNKEVEESCDLGNANLMLVPKGIVNKIGTLSKEYIHGIADFDYTLMAKRKGFLVFSAPGVYGYCIYDHGKKWKSQNTTLKERIAYLYSPKGLEYKEFTLFVQKFFPLDVPIIVVKLWVKTIFPFLYDKFKDEDKIIY